VATSDLKPAARRVLDAMAWLESGRIPMPWHRHVVAFAAEQNPRAGQFRGHAARLVREGLVTTEPEHLLLTDAGREAAAEPDAPYSREDYWRRVDRKLDDDRQRGVALAVRVDPRPWTRTDFHAFMDVEPRALAAALARLITFRLIVAEGDGAYVGTPILTPLTVFERRRAQGRTG